MKKRQSSGENPKPLKRKLTSALCMLLISALLMMSTTYAWLVLSTAPEVSGITTNVGANGALEIALLTSETREDLSKIRTSIGGSIANERVGSANTTWGNLIDLTVADYGLSELVLLPARLQYSQQSDGTYMVDSGLLSVPVYGYDGRIVELTDNTVSAIYKNNEFAYTVGVQDYGVRAIGTSDTLSVQASALAMAKGNITTYTKSANSTAASTLSKNGPDLFGIILSYSAGTNTFDDADVAVIKAMVTDLQKSVEYINLALRYGLVAVAASEMEDKTLFGTVQSRIMDTNTPLSTIINELTELSATSIPASYNTWINKAETAQNNLNAASTACNALTGGSYTWDQLQTPLSYIMNMEHVYINDTPFPDFDSTMTDDLTKNGAMLTLPSGSGVFADVADFAGDYSTSFTYFGVAVDIETLTTVQNGPYLTVLSNSIKDLEAADGSGSGVQQTELSATYGYALDMAFRCNAAGTSNLLLQTTGMQRIYSDSTASATMGGGSYMEFSTKDESLSLEQMLKLMDAVRVAFVDDQGALLNVAKLNTSNRTVTDGVVKAPLYIYDFSFSEEDGAMIMGERQKTNNTITPLEQNVAKALTVVVWLDGDLVDNTMVSATEEASLSGVLNLQFATDADLIPAGNTALKNATTDKTELAAAVEAAKETYELGQGTYTTISWKAFVDAYTYAAAINESLNATEAQVYNASGKLAQATAMLEQVSHEALARKINELRELMGLTTDVVAYVLYDEVNDTYVAVDTYTQEQEDTALGTVYRVDYEKNLHDEGNGVVTPIYTDESWSALAAALYDAEAANMYDEATDAQLDAAITALEIAQKNLQHCVFYVPYEFEDIVYYYAIPRSGEAEEDTQDTYGRWYDNQFQRITSDLTILNLDARAQVAVVAAIEQSNYVTSMSIIAPSVEIFSETYPALRDEEILALQWYIPENLFVPAITSDQIVTLSSLKAEAEALNGDDYDDLQVPEALITEATGAITGVDAFSEAEAVGLIVRLQAAVEAATPITSDQIATLSSLTATAEALNGDAYSDLQVPEALITEATDAITAADANMLTKAEAKDLINRLQAAVEAATPETYEPEEEESGNQLPAPMTADQRTVLTAAVNAAKAVEGYNNSSEPAVIDDGEEAGEGEDPMVALRTAAAEVEALLALETGATAEDADSKLGALNAALTALGKKEVTAYNTLQYTIPVSSDVKTVAYGVEIPHRKMKSTGELGTGTISVVVLTKSGIVFTASVDVEVYSPAAGVEIHEPTEIPVGGVKENVGTEEEPKLVWDKNIQVAETTTLSAALCDADIPQTETIKSYTWASSNADILTVSNEKDAACTVNAVAEGTADVTLSVTTVQGNTYTASMTITVTAVPVVEEEEEPDESGENGDTNEDGESGESSETP